MKGASGNLEAWNAIKCNGLSKIARGQILYGFKRHPHNVWVSKLSPPPLPQTLLSSRTAELFFLSCTIRICTSNICNFLTIFCYNYMYIPVIYVTIFL
jgi:hypothetical protein